MRCCAGLHFKNNHNFLAPVASVSLEFGVAMNAEGQIMAFLNECFGVKSQLAMELDLVVGMWKNLSSLHIDYNKIGNCTVIKNQ